MTTKQQGVQHPPAPASSPVAPPSRRCTETNSPSTRRRRSGQSVRRNRLVRSGLGGHEPCIQRDQPQLVTYTSAGLVRTTLTDTPGSSPAAKGEPSPNLGTPFPPGVRPHRGRCRGCCVHVLPGSLGRKSRNSVAQFILAPLDVSKLLDLFSSASLSPRASCRLSARTPQKQWMRGTAKTLTRTQGLPPGPPPARFRLTNSRADLIGQAAPWPIR